MPGDGPQKPRKWPLRRLRGRGGATLPAKACQALRGPSGAPPKAGPLQAGVCAFGDGPEQLRNTHVAKIPESGMCDLRLTFAKSGLRSQLEEPCEQSHTRRGSRAAM